MANGVVTARGDRDQGQATGSPSLNSAVGGAQQFEPRMFHEALRQSANADPLIPEFCPDLPQSTAVLNTPALRQRAREEQEKYASLYRQGRLEEHDAVGAVVGLVLKDLSAMLRPEELAKLAGILGASMALGAIPGAGPFLSLAFDAYWLGKGGMAAVEILAGGLIDYRRAENQSDRERAAAHIVEGVLGVALSITGAKTLPPRFPKAMDSLKAVLATDSPALIPAYAGGVPVETPEPVVFARRGNSGKRNAPGGSEETPQTESPPPGIRSTRISTPEACVAPRNPRRLEWEGKNPDAAARYAERFPKETAAEQALRAAERGVLDPQCTSPEPIISLMKDGCPLQVGERATVIRENGRLVVERGDYLQTKVGWEGELLNGKRVYYESRFHTNTTNIPGKPPSMVITRTFGDVTEYLMTDTPAIRRLMEMTREREVFRCDASGNIWLRGDVWQNITGRLARDRTGAEQAILDAGHVVYVPGRMWQ